MLLKECREKWEEEGHFKRLNDALVFNQRIWTIFQDEMIRQDNPLPLDIRQNILNLSASSLTSASLRSWQSPIPRSFNILIDINLNIARD
jgi:flagellar protein FlaF